MRFVVVVADLMRSIDVVMKREESGRRSYL
jgi:hypothetical protein